MVDHRHVARRRPLRRAAHAGRARTTLRRRGRVTGRCAQQPERVALRIDREHDAESFRRGAARRLRTPRSSRGERLRAHSRTATETRRSDTARLLDCLPLEETASRRGAGDLGANVSSSTAAMATLDDGADQAATAARGPSCTRSSTRCWKVQRALDEQGVETRSSSTATARARARSSSASTGTRLLPVIEFPTAAPTRAESIRWPRGYAQASSTRTRRVELDTERAAASGR